MEIIGPSDNFFSVPFELGLNRKAKIHRVKERMSRCLMKPSYSMRSWPSSFSHADFGSNVITQERTVNVILLNNRSSLVVCINSNQPIESIKRNSNFLFGHFLLQTFIFFILVNWTPLFLSLCWILYIAKENCCHTIVVVYSIL